MSCLNHCLLKIQFVIHNFLYSQPKGHGVKEKPFDRKEWCVSFVLQDVLSKNDKHDYSNSLPIVQPTKFIKVV